MIGAAAQEIWKRCAKALGHPEWCEDSRFRSGRERMVNRKELEAQMEAVLTTETTEHWVNVLQEAGVPSGPVYNYEQMFNDPQVRHRELIVYADDDELGEVPHIRTPIRMQSGVHVRNTAPGLGQHNTEVFGEFGLTDEDMERLRGEGVL